MTLLERDALSASKIQRRVNIDRSLVYVVLNELIALRLVTRDDSDKVAQFRANSPAPLQSLVQEKVNAGELAQNAYDSVLPNLQQAYEIQTGQPGIRYYAGASGLASFYSKLNADQPKEIYLIRSTYIEQNPEMNQVVEDQIKKQIELNIKVYVLTPTMDDLLERMTKDVPGQIERRVIDRSVFETGAQVLMYNNIVAHTTYRDPTITTVIEHEDIAATYRAMFNVVWQKTQKETEENIEKLRKKNS